MEEIPLTQLALSSAFLILSVFFLWLRQSLSISRIKLFAFLWNKKMPTGYLRAVERAKPLYSLVGTFFFILFVGYTSRIFKMNLYWELATVTATFLIFYMALPWWLSSAYRNAGISLAISLARRFGPMPDPGEENQEEESEAQEGEVEGLIEEAMQEKIIDSEEREILRNVIEFSDTLVREIMTPQREIIAIPYDATFREAAEVIGREKRSRLPLYKDNLDNIQGVVYAKDIVGVCHQEGNRKVSEVMREAVFVPESISIFRALEIMKEKRTKIAIAVDEYGVVSGLITMEDIIEEIFGEITEIDESPEKEIEVMKGAMEVDGDCPLWDLEESLGIEFPEGSYSTISGFIMSHLGRIARRGEEFEYNDYKFKILDADRRSIKKILIRRKG